MPFHFGCPDEPAGYLVVQTPTLAIYGQWPMGGDYLPDWPMPSDRPKKDEWKPIVIEGGKT